MANMTKIGSKESWMEPMNKFLIGATPDLKNFIEQICSVSSADPAAGLNEPQYTASKQVKNRLPASSREGLPSLPFLIDQAKTYAELVEMWVKNVPSTALADGVDQGVQNFHKICTEIYQRTSECLKKAEHAEQPDPRLEHKWQQMLREQQHNQSERGKNIFEQTLLSTPLEQSTEITALPQPTVSLNQHDGDLGGPLSRKPPEQYVPIESISTNSATGSNSWERPRAHTPGPYPVRTTSYSAQNQHHIMMTSNNSSTASFEGQDEHAHPPKSRDGPLSSKNRLKDFVHSSHRKFKGKGATFNGWISPTGDDRTDLI